MRADKCNRHAVEIWQMEREVMFLAFKESHDKKHSWA